MDFGKVFSRAWHISWNNKFLFVLGFLAALGSGSAGTGSSPQANFSFSEGDLPPGWAENLEQFWQEIVAIGVPLLITLLCVGFLLGIILWLVRLASQAGLISAAARIDHGESLSLGEAFRSGLSYLWRMVGLNLLLFAPFILLGLIAAGIAISTVTIASVETFTGPGPAPGQMEQILGGFGIIALCFCLLACILLPLWLIIYVIYPFAQRGIVLAGLGVVASIRHGWNVITRNVGEILLLILFFVVLGILATVVTALVMLPIGLLAFGPAVFDLIGGGVPSASDIVFIILGGLLLLIVSAVINSLLITYRSVTVTLAYEEFVGKEKLAV